MSAELVLLTESPAELEPEPELMSSQEEVRGGGTTSSCTDKGNATPVAAAAAAAADSPMSVLRNELNKVTISHEHVAELLPAIGGFLSANNPLLAAVDAVQSIAHAPAQPKSGLIHWLGEMASEAPTGSTAPSRERERAESSGKGNTAGWFSGFGWGGVQEAEAIGAEEELLADLQAAAESIPRRPEPPQHHDSDDDVGGLEHLQSASSSSYDRPSNSEEAATGESAAGDVAVEAHTQRGSEGSDGTECSVAVQSDGITCSAAQDGVQSIR